MNPNHQDDKLTTSDVAEATRRRPESEVEREHGRRGARPMDGLDERPEPLLGRDLLDDLKARWQSIQTGFVDEPRRAVEEADRLVAETIGALAESFAGARTNLEQQWDRGDDVSTEDLRVALRRYRSFFDRLLSM